MNQHIAVCVLVAMTTTVVDAECGLSRASKLTKERQFLERFVNRDKRNFTEYHVTYRNFSNDLPAFNKTNTDRFQPERWFNVNEEAIDELKMIFDSDFFLFRGLFDIQTVHLELVVNPIECLHTLDAEQLENLTRHFLLNDTELKNPMICSAHIYDEAGTGAIEIRCCELTTTGELICTITKEGKNLFALHVLAISISVVMGIVLIVLWNLIDLGSEDFYFNPKDMTIEVSKKGQEGRDQNVPEQPTGGGDQNVPGLPTGGGDQNVQGQPTGGGDQNVPGQPTGEGDQNVPEQPTGGGDQNVPGQSTGGGDQNVPEQPTGGGDQNVPEQPTGGGDQNVPGLPTGGGDQNVPGQPTGGGDQNVPGQPTGGGDQNVPGQHVGAGEQIKIANRTVKTVQISDGIKGLEELKRKLQGSTHGTQYKVHKIKLSVNKRKCIGNDKSCISFLRCIKEPLNDITNCYCESSKKTRDCCCKPCCYSRCINVNAGAVFMILILLSCAVPLVPLIVHLHSTNSENICTEYRLKGLDCPFYLKNLPLPLIYTNLAISCLNFIIFLAYHCFPKWFCFIAILTEVKDTRFKNYHKIIKAIISVFSFIVIGNFFLTLSYWIYFVLYSFIRVFVTCLGTKNKYDELVLAVLPVLFIFAEKINNVTEQYESIVEVVLNFISKQNNQSTREHSAIIFSPNSNDNSPSDVNFIKCCRELILVINRPLVFNRSRDEKLLSKRFISQMYSKTSDCMACELNHYAKAVLFALIPCSAFLAIFFLFLNFGTTYSYSTEFTGYMAITVTFLTLFKSIPGKVKGAYMVSGISKKWFKREIKDRLLNYGESWTVSDIELIPLPGERKEIEEINFFFKNESRPGQSQV